MRAAPRFTYDVDFVLACTDAEAEQLVGVFLRSGFRVDALLMTKATNRIATVRLLPPRSAVLVDLLFDFTGIEREIVRDATRTALRPGLSIAVATRGHLIAMKVLAFRGKDQLDLEQLLALATPGDLKTARSALEGIRSSGRAMGRDLIATLDALVRARARRAGEFVKVPRSRWPEGWGPQRKKRRGK